MRFRTNITRVIGLTAVFCAAMTVSVFAATQGKVTSDSVNVRAANSTDSNVVMQVDSGKDVTILSKAGDFYQVDLSGLDSSKSGSAYIYSDYVAVVSADGTVNTTDVNLRGGPSTDDLVVGKVNQGDVLTVIAKTGSWYEVSYSGNNYYVYKDYLDGDMLPYVKDITPAAAAPRAPAAPAPATPAAVETSVPITVYAVVTAADGVMLRSGPTTDADALDALPYGEVMDVTTPGDDWVAVNYNGQAGYVKADYVDVRTGQKPSRDDDRRMQVVNYAEQFLGAPYVYGGNSLTRGIDCSGFVCAIMGHFGISLERNSASMAACDGFAVSRSDLLPGDLVFFSAYSGGSSISHVAMYIGGGQIIHASTESTGVIISSLYDDYNASHYVCSRRVL